MADKTADKSTSKAASKSAPKVFDVSKPGKQAASASSRPIIISNRPIMQDPMVTTDKDASDNVSVITTPEAVDSTPSPSSVKLKLQPLSDDEKQTIEVSANPATAADLPAEEQSKDTDADGVVDLLPATDPPETEKAEQIADESKDEQPAEADSGGPSEAAESPTESAVTPAAAQSESSPDDSTELEAQQETATAELEAEAKRQEALDGLVDAKTYFLPINAIERRRSKLVGVLGLFLIVILGLLLLDVMLDAGFVHIPGVQPVTHLF